MDKLSKSKSIRAVDLFCGAGGLTRGLLDAGIEVVAGIDIDALCKFAYESNNPGAQFLCKKVENVTAADLKRYWGTGAIRLLAGCAPCQPFSTYSQARDPSNDERFPLLLHFERLIRETLPELVTMENVPNVALHSVFEQFKKTLESLKYKVWAGVVECPEIGIPQMRRRMVLLASRKSKVAPSFHFKPIKSLPTVRGAIGSLPKLKAGQMHPTDRLHRCQALTPINQKRIKASKPGRTWRDWPEQLRLPCHKRESGKGYASVYGRMNWDLPGPTMTTQCYNYGSGRFGHPKDDRPISLREAALIQSFPKNYQFDSESVPLSVQKIAKMIGNAVPVLLGEAVGNSLKKSLK